MVKPGKIKGLYELDGIILISEAILNSDVQQLIINELAKKAKTEGLTPEETEERDRLRKAYIADFRRSLESHLKNTYVVDAKGNKTKLQKKR